MKEQFVTYEIAFKLKELGFDGGYMAVYLSKDNFKIEYGLLNYPKELFGDIIKAPLWQQVIDWFREKHNIIIEVWFDYTQININEFLWIYEIYVNNNQHDHDGSWYDNFNECREFAILKAIELLNNDKSKR
jgi:hypothetical protein